MTQLADLCTNVLSLVVQLRASDDYGAAEALRERISGLFDSFKRDGETLELRGSELREAEYALTALIDETIARSKWEHKVAWLSHTLMVEKFGTANAGEDLFKKLDDMRQDVSANQAMLEVYYLCLTLGFEGKYKLLGSEHLKEIVSDLAEVLNLRSRRATQLSPRWKRTNEVIQAMTSVPGRIPVWLVMISCVLITMVIYLLASAKMETLQQATLQQIGQSSAVVKKNP